MNPPRFALDGLRALRRAARLARKEAKMHGTRLVIMRRGKIVKVRP